MTVVADQYTETEVEFSKDEYDALAETAHSHGLTVEGLIRRATRHFYTQRPSFLRRLWRGIALR